MKAREVDPDVIPENEYPDGYIPITINGSFNENFDRVTFGDSKCLLEFSDKGPTKIFILPSQITSFYNNFEHFYSQDNEDRYAIIYQSTYSNTQKRGLTIYDADFNIIDSNIGFNGYNTEASDAHDFVYIDDTHVILIHSEERTISVKEQEKLIKGERINELKKENGVWKVIGTFCTLDYPQLCTDAFGELGDVIDNHANTIELDYDGNLILNQRNWDSWIKIKRVENLDGTVTLGSKTFDYDEAIIGRVGGRHNSGYLDSKRVLNEEFSFIDIPASLNEVSDDAWEEWQWFHCHDVKYWGMKQIGDKQYPTYTLFDNNYCTMNRRLENEYNTLNKNNNSIINPFGVDDSHYNDGNDEKEGYSEYTISRIIQISIDWDNHLVKDYKIYKVPKMYSRATSGATMYSEGVISICYGNASTFGLWDFTEDSPKRLFIIESNANYRGNTYSLKN